jgi:LacI family transcriptional regulator
MNTKATLKNISKSLNLSISTVSRALKNHPDISDATKKKVNELAELLEYEPNTHAINLRTNKSMSFGLIVPEISNYFYHSFIAAMEKQARASGYSLLILQSGDDPQMELENLKLCKTNRVAGIFICISSKTQNIKPFQKLDEAGIPLIFFDKVPAYEAFNKICLADTDAARIAAATIVKKGRKNILAIMGDASLSITQKRERAFIEGLEAGDPSIKCTIEHAEDADQAFRLTMQHLSSLHPPDTVFTMSDEILTGTMRAIQKLKLSIPQNVGVISICNDHFIPRLFEPEITFIETSGAELGKLALKRMMDHLSGKTFIQELTLPSRLVEGGSL